MFEHIKSKSTDAEGKPAGIKTHAGGGHDRQDAYLYGHPGGRKKRYRSPADFFPHLLWLATDEVGDPNNCTCKLCAPDDIQPEEKQPKVLKQAVKKEEVERKPPVKTAAYVEITSSKPLGTKLNVPQRPAPETVKPAPQPAPVPQQAAPAPLPQPQSIDQRMDFEYGKFTFRNGELVWFQRQAGTWGLAVIVRRWQSSSRPKYLVQPLSYPGDFQTQKPVDSEG